ncbi:MAG: cytochrome c biogenesis protein CcsA [Flavobacteriales bacterium]
MKKICGLLFSTRFTGFLLLLLALSMAVATFIENDYGAMTARALVYHAAWFELALFLLALNFAGNIKRYRLWQRDKFPVLLFHLAFYVILLGAALTRWTGYAGRMFIKEGESSNRVITDRVYFRARIDDNRVQRRYPDREMQLSAWGSNRFSQVYPFRDKAVRVELMDYIPLAVAKVVRDVPGGDQLLHIVVSAGGSRRDHYIKRGGVQSISGLVFAFDKQVPGAIQISTHRYALQLQTPFDGVYRIMATQQTGTIRKDQLSDLHLRTLYQIKGIGFVIPEVIPRAKVVLKAGDKRENAADLDVLQLRINSGGQTQYHQLFGKGGRVSPETPIAIDGLNVYLSYGSKSIELPFSIALRDFQMKRYPGSNSPSSYASEITIIDPGRKTDYRIFMNHVLDHRGNRFFQAAYFPDETGTILSVNHDFWGTWISYIGYLLMALGMLLTLFSKGSRFWHLREKLREIDGKRAATAILFFLSLSAFAQLPSKSGDPPIDTVRSDSAWVPPFHLNVDRDSLVQAQYIDAEKAAEFGRLVVQRADGRMQPIHTLATDVLRKVYRHNAFSYETQGGGTIDMTPDQVFLGMHYNPMAWQLIPIIYVPDALKRELDHRLKTHGNYATPLAFFDARADYTLLDYVQKAYEKRPAERTAFDQAVIRVDERVNIVWAVFQGRYLKIFPKPADSNHSWYSFTDEKADFQGVDAQVQKRLIPSYFNAITRAKRTGDWTTADRIVSVIDHYQKKVGAAVMPSPERVKWEIRYTQWRIFFELMIAYALLGTLLLISSFAALFKPARWLRGCLHALTLLIFIGFLFHIGGLALRWYITGHPPWSNGYEATVFIAAVAVLSGLIFARRDNRFALAAAALMAVMLMGVAYGNLMSPQLTDLEPVLKSYWLMIHVAVITGSYGFLGLGAFLGLIALVLITIRNPNTGRTFDTTLAELSYINEMTLTIGLFMLTVGTFLGGVWASESWGRYWGWDPKETWALISVMVYTFVLHMRLMPRLNNLFAFHAASLLAVSAIIMTYFGVNYYLSGLHSYAKGDPVPIPIWVYISVGLICVLIAIAYLRHRNYQYEER